MVGFGWEIPLSIIIIIVRTVGDRERYRNRLLRDTTCWTPTQPFLPVVARISISLIACKSYPRMTGWKKPQITPLRRERIGWKARRWTCTGRCSWRCSCGCWWEVSREERNHSFEEESKKQKPIVRTWLHQRGVRLIWIWTNCFFGCFERDKRMAAIVLTPKPKPDPQLGLGSGNIANTLLQSIEKLISQVRRIIIIIRKPQQIV